MTNIYITGSRGQLGQALFEVLQSDYRVTGGDLPADDVTRKEVILAAIEQAAPELVVHCAAYTDVDGCARHPKRAYRVNGLGTQNVALACRALDIPMLHVSTNEVFAGNQPGGYEEWMPAAPINAYGRSKAAAEFFVRSLAPRYYIVRISWLFAHGGGNFVHSILRAARQRGELRVVADEIGNPTYALDTAQAMKRLIESEQYGVYHLVNSGPCSRWEFAREILRQAGLNEINLRPIRLRDYDRPSRPPRFGSLTNMAGAALGITLRSWREALAAFMIKENIPEQV